MDFLPIDRMWDRIETGKAESDTTYFYDLMYLGEMVCKLITLGLVSSLEDSRDNHKYRLNFELVRADGIGTWVKVANEAIIGPAAQYTYEEARIERRELTEKKQGTWQNEAVNLLNSCLEIIDPHCEHLQSRVDGKKWLEIFAQLRNKTRGHGAITGDQCNQIIDNLRKSIGLFTENFYLFKRPWAYLHRNRSGKYRVSKISRSGGSFDYLKSRTDVNVPNGVYTIFDGQLCMVELLETNVDLLDFYLANGGFTTKKYELISYISNQKVFSNSVQFLLPVSELPRSETKSLRNLNVIGNVLTNMPDKIQNYIQRELLESELMKILENDRHPIITLLGRGGIGKTSLSLKVLHTIANNGRFNLIIWLSARDIDLLAEGPKQVSPDVTTLKEIAKQYWSLVDELVLKEKTEIQVQLFADELTNLQDYGPTLFIFDNFETVSNPLEMYNFIDTYIRNPNKVLITTRHREFKGDYPIEVSGMSKNECDELALTTSDQLGIKNLITSDFLNQLYHNSEGHPYVVKILLGELSKSGSNKSLERILTNREDMLEALFERTYSLLSEETKRVFLTLCNWRSVVPQLALEAVMLRSSTQEQKIRASEAIDELSRISFIEVITSNIDGQLFISVPLVAEIFGKKKLAISPYKSLVEADTLLLQSFGASQKHEIRNGIEPKIRKLFKNLERLLSVKKTTINENIPMLEFIARHFHPTWILIANLYEKYGDKSETIVSHVKNYLEHYLETPDDEEKAIEVWQRIANIEEKRENWKEYIHALVEKSLYDKTPFVEVSEAANKINQLISTSYIVLDFEEKQIALSKLGNKMKSRIMEATATDCSRLCWLFLNLDELEEAKAILEYGLKLDPVNEHCQKLQNRLYQKQ